MSNICKSVVTTKKSNLRSTIRSTLINRNENCHVIRKIPFETMGPESTRFAAPQRDRQTSHQFCEGTAVFNIKKNRTHV